VIVLPVKSVFAVGLVLLSFAASAGAYALENIVWGVDNPVISLNLDASEGKLGSLQPAFPLQDGSTSFDQVFTGAVSDWNQYLLNLQIQAVEGNNPAGFDGNNQLNEAGFGAAAGGDTLGGDTLAITEIYYYPGNPGTFAPTDIVFNTTFSWNSYRGPLQPSETDLRRVALHELGHFIGLDHPDQAGQTVSAVMNSHVSDTDELTSDDISGGQHLYGVRTAYSPTPGSTIYVAGDFSGTGKTDLLWRNVQTGQLGIWVLSNLAVTQISTLLTTSPNWQVVALADLNGDGKSDIIFRNANAGNFGVWFMDGPSVVSTQAFNLPEAYSGIAFGNYNGDGALDVIQYDPASGNVSLSKNLGNLNFSEQAKFTVATKWALVGLADIRGNGQPGILWRDTTTGALGIWFISNFSIASAQVLGTPSLDWRLRAIGNFSGHVSQDLFWVNANLQEAGLWVFNSDLTFSVPNVYPVPPGWTALGSGVEPAGSMVIWYNTGNYKTGAWFLNGGSLSSLGSFGPNPGPNWRVQPDPGN
jgi:hypothetical protein